MDTLRRLTQALEHWFQVITDWLLILLGTGLIAVSLKAIDVPLARWLVAGTGALLALTGLWFRYRRRRQRNAGSGE